MQSSRPGSTSTRPGGTSPLFRTVNTQTLVLDGATRILCVADIRGRLSHLNDLAREAGAKAIIHTGDFGFFESSSLESINDRTLRHLTMYSPLIPHAQRTHLLAPENPPAMIRSTVDISLLSEFPLLLSGQLKLQVPVYTVWGACESVAVLEKFRAGTYAIDNLHVLDEATTRLLDVGGVKLRLLGLGGALVPHKMFDNGEGNATIAGGQGTMWTTALQIGELVDTAQRVFDSSETRLLVSHASPGREGIIAQLALVLKADLTISAGLHFRYATSYNEFSVQGDFEGFRHKLAVGKDGFDKVWESVKTQVDAVIDENQRVLLDKALSVIDRVPAVGPASAEEPAWKNCWNWNLCDAAYGSLVLDVKEGRVSAELKSQGFNFAYRRNATFSATPNHTTGALPPNQATGQNITQPPTKASTPAPADQALPPHIVPKTNGTSAPTPTASDKVASDKAEKDRVKKKEKKERKDRERAERDASDAAFPATAPAEASNSSIANDDPKSPATESTGIRTPTSKRGARNPWTLFVRMSVPVNETEMREFFGAASSGITRVNFPTGGPGYTGRIKYLSYVEFGDEEAMRAGLEKHAEKMKDTVPEVKIAVDKETLNAERGGSIRGRGRGFGGRGSGFAARGLAHAGLTRKPSDAA